VHGEAVRAFLLGFPALFSIINPLSGAFIFFEVTLTRTSRERERLAKLVAIYALLVMVVALWVGSYILAFFGITVAALRVAGGLVITAAAWGLLSAPEKREAQKLQQAAPAEGASEIALFPLTIPFTTGPGTISVRSRWDPCAPHLGLTAAALANAVLIWAAYRLSAQVTRLLGPTGTRTATRLFAFLLLCIGIQILMTGVVDVLQPLLSGHSSG
jgi:multiple antibiotic resistance protein